MNIILKFSCIIASFGIFSTVLCQNLDNTVPQPGKQVSINDGLVGDVIDNYWLYLPKEFNDSKKWPIILFLQGGHGISPDSTTSKVSGPVKYALKENEDKIFDSYVKDSFLIINPHMRPGSYWERQWYQQYSSLNSILNYIIKNYAGDSSRIYVTGLSRGGNGTWGIAQCLNNRIAAIIPVCGLTHGITDYSCFIDLPIWITHGTNDKTHLYDESVNAVKNIEQISGTDFLKIYKMVLDDTQIANHKHIFTTFENAGHNVWDNTYDKVEIYKWLLNQTNKNAP